MAKDELKITINPNSKIPTKIEQWSITENVNRIDESCRIAIENKNFNYAIYFDALGNPYLNIWSKNDKGEIAKEVFDESIDDISTAIWNTGKRLRF